MLKKSEGKVLEELKKLAKNARGRSYFFAMRNPDDSIEVHTERENIVCYGEMRKYDRCLSTGVRQKNCTRSDDLKPRDLKFPFPDGIIEAVSFGIKFSDNEAEACKYNRFNDREGWNYYMDFILSGKSPWVKGFGSSKDIYKVEGDTGFTTGFVCTDTEIDPTVLVSMMCFIQVNSNFKNFAEIKSVGGSDLEAIAYCFTTGGKCQYGGGWENAYGYYWSTKPDLHKIANGTPIDLTGGTWRDGFDYERVNLSQIFADGEVNLSQEYNKQECETPKDALVILRKEMKKCGL